MNTAASADQEVEYESLLQFIYLAPVGLVQTSLDGTIVLINPFSAQLLMPLSHDGTLSNLFTALERVAPDLRHRVGCFAGNTGRVCDDVRFQVTAGNRVPESISLSLVKLDADRLMAVFADITLQVAHELELAKYRQHLEELVAERTVALEQANAAAAAAYNASVERLHAEREAKIRSSKLEAVGTLAAGIAHDFNNILASILANAELADDELPDDSGAKSNVALIIKGSFRARDLVARLLDFARERGAPLVPVNVVLQVREAIVLLRASLPRSIELTFASSMPETTPSILADPTQIMQIVMNLCINAAHAMDNDGVIRIAVEAAGGVAVGPTERRDCVCISVTDTGSGMTPAVMERIFDPFFTTKAPGDGSGLGLSVVYGIVKYLGGVVEVQSSAVPGHSGTQFHVFLPSVCF